MSAGRNADILRFMTEQSPEIDKRILTFQVRILTTGVISMVCIGKQPQTAEERICKELHEINKTLRSISESMKGQNESLAILCDERLTKLCDAAEYICINL